jgi:hypothetical protein
VVATSLGCALDWDELPKWAVHILIVIKI